jgi:osmotically-inducible protein OsmY
MAVRAAIALSLAALACAGSARAEDDPACAQYREAMAYNACLARHGPKANGVGTLSGQFRSSGVAPDRAPRSFQRWQGVQRAHGRMHMEFRVQ